VFDEFECDGEERCIRNECCVKDGWDSVGEDDESGG
jgi:hypothetical protein